MCLLPESLFFAVVMAIFALWTVLEWRKGGPPSKALFGAAIVCAVIAAGWLAMIPQCFDYNAYYGRATNDLIKSTIDALEAGRVEDTIRQLRWLEDQYKPSYENRAEYRQLAEEYCRRLGIASTPSSRTVKREGASTSDDP